MHKSIKIIGAVGAAGIVAAGGSAFTNSNTGVNDAYVGYDDALISGVTVTNIEYVVDSSDASKLSSIVFTSTEDVSANHDAILVINGPVGTQIDCDESVANTITCSTTGQLIASVTSVSLTVAQQTTPTPAPVV